MRLDANDLAMLNIISKRFRKTRDLVAQELLSSALVDFFSLLETTERKLLARDADDAARSLANEIAEENGVRNLDIKTGVWANHERHLTKVERKKAKLTVQESEQETAEIDEDASLAATKNNQPSHSISLLKENQLQEPTADTADDSADSEHLHETQQDSQPSVASMVANQ